MSEILLTFWISFPQVTKQLLQTMAEHAAREAEVQGTLERLACAEKEKEAGERIMQSLEQR